MATAGVLGLTGCNDGGDETGYLSLAVSDSPIHDATKVCLAFTTVEVKPVDGPWMVIDLVDEAAGEGPIIVDLLEYQGSHAASLLFDYELKAGEYESMRLGVDAVRGGTGANGATADPENGCDGEGSFLATESGAVYNIFVPSGAQTGLKFNGFTVPVNGVAAMTAEWDLQRSFLAPPGLDPDAIAKPVVRLVYDDEVGTLAGQVDAALMESCDAPSVYLFGDGVTPNGIEEAVTDADDPIATAMVHERVDESAVTTYHYEIGFILPGSYEAAFTCDGASFIPEAGKEAVIEALQTETVDFTAADVPEATPEST
jgi:hypothetical protein